MEFKLKTLIIASLCIVLNIIGSFIALALRLPIYLDTIGTILSALLFGPLIGGITGGLTNIIVGISFDPTSIYFLPVQLTLGIITGFLFKKSKYWSFKSVIKILIITLICSILSSLISTFVFSGVTSSGSAYFINMLRLAGSNLLLSVFSVQFITDLLDKFLAFWISFIILNFLKKNLVFVESNSESLLFLS